MPAHRPTTLFPYTTLFRSAEGSWYLATIMRHKEMEYEHWGLLWSLIPLGSEYLVGGVGEGTVWDASFTPDGQSVMVSFSFWEDRKSTRLNSSHQIISYAVF